MNEDNPDLRPARTARSAGVMMLNGGTAGLGRIDALTHLASLAGETLVSPMDGAPFRILGVSRDSVYVMSHGSPLGAQIPVAAIQSAFDRLTAGEDVPVTASSLGEHFGFVAAAILSLPGSVQLDQPVRVRLQGSEIG